MTYFRREYIIPLSLEPEQFKKFSADAQAICKFCSEHCGSLITFNDRETSFPYPLISENAIFDDCRVEFNGYHRNGCEKLHIHQNIERVYGASTEKSSGKLGRHSVRTDALPYDIAVSACLILLKLHFAEVSLLSNTEYGYELDSYLDWREGGILLLKVFSEGLLNLETLQLHYISASPEQFIQGGWMIQT